METFTLVPRGPFSLAASIKFLEGFTPAEYAGAGEGVLELAFPVEGSWRTAGVRVCQAPGAAAGGDVCAGDAGAGDAAGGDGGAGDAAGGGAGTGGAGAGKGGSVIAEVISPAGPEAGLVAEIRAQVERILSLDVDGSGFPAVGERDPVVGEVQRRYPGLRPVGFWSPYEAAAWTIIGHRIRITQAAAIKARMAERLGEPVSFGGRVVYAFPAPQRLAELDTFPGLAGRKPEWLRSLALAALDGRLDAARLRAMPHEEAMADLKRLPGIGDFSAGLILLRGAGDPDAVADREPRLGRAVALAYGLPGQATPERVREISENWRPYRTWVTLLLRVQLEDETGEIAGRQRHARTR
jgi:DNA-3-methyladenine glycosylase II